MTINALVWNENILEQTDKEVQDVYPDGIHGCIAQALNEDKGISATTTTLQEPEQGLTEEKLSGADVLVYWSRKSWNQIDDAIAERVVERVWAGMGLIALHSAQLAKPFTRLMGTPCDLGNHRGEEGELERVWVINKHHEIARDLPQYFELEHEEMFGEPFGIPEPLETVFISWYQGGEVFRSGVTYRRGAGKIFYFQPGHETHRAYHDKNVRKVLRNAVRWAHSPNSAAMGNQVSMGEYLEPVPEQVLEK